MKKIIFALAAIVLISSCSKQEITDSVGDTNSTIGFNSYVNRLTRAVDADLPALKVSGFDVFGYYSADGTGVFTPNFFNAKVVSWGTAWTYPNIQYWPATGILDFIAVAKNTGTFSAHATNGALIAYAGSSTLGDQKDLLVATKLGQSKVTNGSSPVALEFKHVLSSINIRVKNNDTDPSLTLVVKSIKFTGISPEGSYKVNGAVWTKSGTAADYSIGLTGGVDFKQVGTATPAFVAPHAAAGALIIVPQAQTTIEVEYQYVQSVGGVDIVVSDHTGLAKKSATLSGNWNTDTKYTYDLTIANDMLPISFTATVASWTNSVTVTPSL